MIFDRFTETLPAIDLRRRSTDALHVSDLGRFAAEGVDKQLTLQTTVFDIVGSDVCHNVDVRVLESGTVVDLDHGNTGVVRQLDARQDAFSRGRQENGVNFRGDEILQNAELL